MMMLYTDGSMEVWPEWVSTVPQNQWNNDQIQWMVDHQTKVLRLQREAAQRIGGDQGQPSGTG
jgi:hypothetical protein